MEATLYNKFLVCDTIVSWAGPLLKFHQLEMRIRSDGTTSLSHHRHSHSMRVKPMILVLAIVSDNENGDGDRDCG